jgi:superfamily II helicase
VANIPVGAIAVAQKHHNYQQLYNSLQLEISAKIGVNSHKKPIVSQLSLIL